MIKPRCLFVFLCAAFGFCQCQAVEILSEVRAAYYYPTDSRFRDIYSDAGLYSFEVSVQAYKKLYPWTSVGFLYTSGHSVGEGDSTELYMIPLGLGLKYFFDFRGLKPYLGAGLVTGYVHIHNDSAYVERNQSDWVIGGVVKTGFLADLSEAIFFDFFMDYTYLTKNFDSSSHHYVVTRKGHLSGLSFGAGLGYRF